MVLSVPYFKQVTPWSCAVACAEMVAAFHGQTLDQRALTDQLKKPVPGMQGAYGVFNKDLCAAMSKRGFEVDCILFRATNPTLIVTKLREHMDRHAHPLIASQRSTLTGAVGGHSRLIVGVE